MDSYLFGGSGARRAWFLCWLGVFFDAAEVVLSRHAFNESLRAYVALERAILFELWACFPSASRGFGQDG